MNYPMRSIAFITELIHPPMNYQAADLQKLHSLAFSDVECQYHNFQMLPMGAQMSNPPGRTRSISSCAILNDRIQIREELTGISRGDYETRLGKLAALCMRELKIPAFLVLNIVVRTLVNTKNFKDSREYVAKGLFNMEADNFRSLDRGPEILGLRLVLGKPDSNEGVFNLRIESYNQDPRSLFIENVGAFRMMIKEESLKDLSEKFTSTYAYIETHVVPFLAQFDEVP
ncbi:MAG: hypothetical protein ACYTG7_03835 [Planctomycetota bacterium]|jgi:hypothetical protein